MVNNKTCKILSSKVWEYNKIKEERSTSDHVMDSRCHNCKIFVVAYLKKIHNFWVSFGPTFPLIKTVCIFLGVNCWVFDKPMFQKHPRPLLTLLELFPFKTNQNFDSFSSGEGCSSSRSWQLVPDCTHVWSFSSSSESRMLLSRRKPSLPLHRRRSR